jgi:hypothetical protein
MNTLSVTLCSLLSSGAIAPAEDGERETGFVAVLPVRSGSGISEDRADLVLSTVRSQLPAQEIIVAPQDRVRDVVTKLGTGCGTPAECQKQIGKQLDVQYLFSVTVDEPSKQDFSVKVVLTAAADGEEIAAFEELCTICSEADLKRVVQERTLDARLALQRILNPQDFDDGDVPVPVVVEKPAENRTEVRLKERSKLVPIGWGLLGAGAAATVGGVVLMSLQGSGAGCPDDPRGGRCIPLVYDTLIPGAIVGGVGVALLGTGIGLVVAGKKRDRGTREQTARVGFGAGSVTLSGRF